MQYFSVKRRHGLSWHQLLNLLLESALAFGIGALIKDKEYLQCLADEKPLDLYIFTKTVYAFLKHPTIIQAILDESITEMEQLPF